MACSVFSFVIMYVIRWTIDWCQLKCMPFVSRAPLHFHHISSSENASLEFASVYTSGTEHLLFKLCDFEWA